MSFLIRHLCGFFGLSMALAVLLPAHAAPAGDYPNQTIRVVVANTPGSSVDTVARHLVDHISKQLGVSTFIDNKPGAGGLIGSQNLVRSAPDGYTMGVMSSSYVIMPHLNANLTFDPLGDIRPIALVGTLPIVLVTSMNSPYKTAEALIQAAKGAPNTLTYGSPGVGTALHLGGVQLQSLTDTNFLHIPYKGVSPLLVDTVSGTVNASMLTVGSAVKLIEEGKLRALAVSSPTEMLPDVPTLADAGVPGFDFESWVVVMAPKGVPDAVAQIWSEKVRNAVLDPAFGKVLITNGMTPKFMDLAETKAFLKVDFDKSGELVKSASSYAQ